MWSEVGDAKLEKDCVWFLKLIFLPNVNSTFHTLIHMKKTFATHLSPSHS